MKDKILKNFFAASGIIFGFAFLLRFLFWFFLKQNYFFYGHPADDVIYYQEWAVEISRLDWLGTKTFFGLPLYPYFLAVLDRLFLGQEILIRLFHLLLGSFNCVLAFILARKIFSQKTALLAGILAATNFSLIYYDWMFLPVSLVITLSLLILIILASPDQIQTRRGGFLLGILLGLTALGDGKILIFSSLIIIFIHSKGKITAVIQKSLLLILGLMLILGLTGLRNKLVGGSWVWITAQRGLSFYVGNNPQATGVFANPDFIRPTHQGQDIDQIMRAELLSGRKLTAAQVSQFWFKEGVSFIQNQPLDYLKLLGRKFVLFFRDTERASDIDLLLLREWRQRLDINSFYLICPLALIGIFLTRKREETKFSNLLLLSQLIFTLIFFLYNRQRVTVLPVFLIYEAFTLCWIIEQFKRKNFRSLIYQAAAILTFLILLKPQTVDSQTLDFLRHAKAGPIYEKRKEFKKAQEEYFKALKLEPRDTNTLYNLANSFFLEGDFIQAERYYKEVLTLNPHQTDALFNLGYVYEERKDLAQALVFYEKVLELEGPNVDTYLRIAQVYQTRGECDKAQRYYQGILQIKPHLAEEIKNISSSCRNP